MDNGISTIFIFNNLETVWNAITDDEKLSKWYAPGSKWIIPNLKVGEKAKFILMPSTHNNLKENESVSMSFTITEVITNQKLSYSQDSNNLVLTFELFSEKKGTRVTINTEGFEQSLANLNAFLEGRELPFV